MAIDYSGGFDFSALQARLDEILPGAVKDGMQIVLDNAKERAPKETSELVDSATLDEPVVDHGGITASFTFHAPWARKEHEHLYYEHNGTGGPKYAELALASKGAEAVAVAGERIAEALHE